MSCCRSGGGFGVYTAAASIRICVASTSATVVCESDLPIWQRRCPSSSIVSCKRDTSGSRAIATSCLAMEGMAKRDEGGQ